ALCAPDRLGRYASPDLYAFFSSSLTLYAFWLSHLFIGVGEATPRLRCFEAPAAKTWTHIGPRCLKAHQLESKPNSLVLGKVKEFEWAVFARQEEPPQGRGSRACW